MYDVGKGNLELEIVAHNGRKMYSKGELSLKKAGSGFF